MKILIKDLIRKNEIQSKTITSLINNKDTTENDREKYEACRRFVQGFISDLKNLPA